MPPRIDLSGMGAPRTRGEVTRFDVEQLLAALEPQTVNRASKRDRVDVVTETGLPLGMAREALGQAALLGYGDDIEGYLTGRNAGDIRRERGRFADENPLAANGAYLGGLAAGGALPRVVRLLAGGPRSQVDDAPPRFQPDLRQAMRNVEEVEASNRPTDSQRDAIERLLSNPEARAEVRGQPMELSPADIFTMTVGAPQGAPAPTAEDDLSAMSPLDRLRLETEIASNQPVSPSQAGRNQRQTAEELLSIIPGPANVIAARDAARGAGDAVSSFGSGDWRGGLLNSALAALSGVGAVTALPTSKLAANVAREAKDSVAVFVPAGPSKKADLARTMRDEGRTNRDVFSKTGKFFGPEGTLRSEIPDRQAVPTLEKFQPGDMTTMGDVINHHALFRDRPDLAEMPVRITGLYSNATGVGEPVARMVGEGVAEVSRGGSDEWARQNIAKLLQYQIAREAGFGDAVTHKAGDVAKTYDAAGDAVQRIISDPQRGEDAGAAIAWLERAQPIRDRLARSLGTDDEWRAARQATNATSGNADARIVKSRATMSDENLRKWGKYPYKQGINWDSIQVLPQPGSSREQIAEFLANWRNYGAGRGP